MQKNQRANVQSMTELKSTFTRDNITEIDYRGNGASSQLQIRLHQIGLEKGLGGQQMIGDSDNPYDVK